MKKPTHQKKGRYAKPQVISKVIRLMMNTFGTAGAVTFGPHRGEAPRRPGN